MVVRGPSEDKDVLAARKVAQDKLKAVRAIIERFMKS